MKVSISSEIFDKYGNVAVGAVVAKGIKNVTPDNYAISNATEEASKKGSQNLSKYDHLVNLPFVQEWREIYKKMGCSASKSSSIEGLYSYLAKNDRLPNIAPMVNLYNAISCNYGLPMAGYNYDCITNTEIILRSARKKEPFQPLGSKHIEKTKNGEVIYADSEKVICRYWNYRDSDQTKIQPETTNFLFILDGAPSINIGTINTIVDPKNETVC